MGAQLDELLKRGMTQLAAFIPWQAAESDIAHTLTRFLQAAAERKLNVYLILSPEVGIHYPLSGLPKDVMRKKENSAQHGHQGPVNMMLPPQHFQLPSLFSPDVTKRYYSYLSKMDGYFHDLSQSQPQLMAHVSIVLSGSLWKYYRSPLGSSPHTFGDRAGDYSNHASVAFRQRLEQYFAQKEFQEPTAASANRWKSRSLEDLNRKWFYQHSEDVFKTRSYQTLRRKSSKLKLLEVELFTPEADPGLTYASFLQLMSGHQHLLPQYSSLLDEYSKRISMGALPTLPWVHWSGLKDFRNLPEAEKQFLFMKSILLMGGQTGAVLLDATEWLSFSSSFRSKAEALARSISEKNLKLKTQAFYLAPHLWSNYGPVWMELTRKLGSGVKLTHSMDLIHRAPSARLIIVDPSLMIQRETILKLMAWVRGGRVVVLPRSQFYTEQAKKELDHHLQGTQKMEMNLQFSYHLHRVGEGKLITYELPDSWSLKPESISSWQSFLESIISLAELEKFCQFTSPQLEAIPLEIEPDRVALFVLNSHPQPVSGDLVFSRQVKVSDLAGALLNQRPRKVESSPVDPAEVFTLDVPPHGIVPLMVEELEVKITEARLAAHSSSLREGDQVQGTV